jgi:hypothetical protein
MPPPFVEHSVQLRQFHPFAELAGITGIELLDFEVHEQTNFALLATVGIDPRTARLFLLVSCDPEDVTAAQTHEYANTFMRALAAVVRSPEQAIDLGTNAVTARDVTQLVSEQAAIKPDIGMLSAPDRSAVAPRTPAEAALVDVFASVLGVDSVGVHDNFFTIGGDSILALVVRSKAEKRGIAFDIEELYAAHGRRTGRVDLSTSAEPPRTLAPVRTASTHRPRGAARRRRCVPRECAAIRNALPQHRARRFDDV